MAFEDVKFTKEHEWIRIEGDKGRVGITEYAQHELGDVVYVELPKLDRLLKKGDPCANIESVKAVSDVYSPISGSIKEVNGKLGDHPELINQDPHGEGWLFLIQMADQAEMKDLFNHIQYQEYLKGIGGE